MTPNQKRGALVLASVSLLASVSIWEGTEKVAYADKLAHGLPTVCNGHTGPDVRVGDVWTKEQCDAILRKDVAEHGAGILSCIKTPVNQNQYDALADWAFNIGIKAACQSTLVALLNQGRYAEACDQLLRWDRASGKAVTGLTKRRKAERDLCLKPVSEISTTKV